jgi:hypothetical protein
MDDTPEERGRKRKKKEKSCQPSPPSFAQRRTFHPTFEFDWSKSARIKSPEITGQLRSSPGMKEFVCVLSGNTELLCWLAGGVRLRDCVDWIWRTHTQERRDVESEAKDITRAFVSISPGSE